MKQLLVGLGLRLQKTQRKGTGDVRVAIRLEGEGFVLGAKWPPLNELYGLLDHAVVQPHLASNSHDSFTPLIRRCDLVPAESCAEAAENGAAYYETPTSDSLAHLVCPNAIASSR
jgi:hypothetical protein